LLVGEIGSTECTNVVEFVNVKPSDVLGYIKRTDSLCSFQHLTLLIGVLSFLDTSLMGVFSKMHRNDNF
jgi:hypothetical protein